MAVDELSVAELVSVAMAVPDTFDWSPGLVTETELVIVHEKEVDPW